MLQGAAGFSGFPGFKGSAGIPGRDGDRGPSGPPGHRGDPGAKVKVATKSVSCFVFFNNWYLKQIYQIVTVS